MNIREHYNKLYEESVKKILTDQYRTDPLIEDESDNRFGITLLARPTHEVKENIQEFLAVLKKIEPHQYYYPNTDIHITIMSIISCYDGFDLESIDLLPYIELIGKCIDRMDAGKINVRFEGVTASDSCIMIQGFDEGDQMNNFRNDLRRSFEDVDIEQSLDKRYPIKTAHSTVLRFSNELKGKQKFLDAIEEFRNHNFGMFSIDQFELVYNDWYHKNNLVKTLHRFVL